MNSFKYFFYNDNNKANLFFIEDVININVNKTNNEVKLESDIYVLSNGIYTFSIYAKGISNIICDITSEKIISSQSINIINNYCNYTFNFNIEDDKFIIIKLYFLNRGEYYIKNINILKVDHESKIYYLDYNSNIPKLNFDDKIIFTKFSNNNNIDYLINNLLYNGTYDLPIKIYSNYINYYNIKKNAIELNNNSYIEFHYLNFNNIENNNSIAILLNNCENIIINKFNILNFGIYIKNCNKINIYNSFIINCENNGIYIENCKNINIFNCKISSNKQNGIYIINSEEINIYDNLIDWNNYSALQIKNSKNINIFNNNIYENYDNNKYGIILNQCDYIYLNNNNFSKFLNINFVINIINSKNIFKINNKFMNYSSQIFDF